ncbi:MAG: hypothetical protein EOP06_21750 [Proteobacteria bacterium]|nr:MAG: hypothetical protein EOP06_21750 [Pseudomonadota bacterium]
MFNAFVTTALTDSFAVTSAGFFHSPVTASSLRELTAFVLPPQLTSAACIRYEAPQASEQQLESIEIFLGLSHSLCQLSANNASLGFGEEPEFKDLAGEILNVTFGNFDPRMRAHGQKWKSSFAQPISATAKLNLAPASAATVFSFRVAGQTLELIVFKSGTFKFPWKYTPVK